MFAQFAVRGEYALKSREVHSRSGYEQRSLIITTNKDFTSWHEFFFDDNVAVPIVDRIIHHSKIFMLGGESYRLRQN